MTDTIKKGEHKTVNLRLSIEVYNFVMDQAAKENRSFNNMVETLLKRHISRPEDKGVQTEGKSEEDFVNHFIKSNQEKPWIDMIERVKPIIIEMMKAHQKGEK